jgi:S1-C subfamily serine protease/predicted esterase
MSRYTYVLLLGLAGASWAGAQGPPAGADLNELNEKAIKEAVARVAPSVVQIQTQGGADMVKIGPKGPVFRKALGPTTGLVVSPDGYILSSAFNFVNNPSSIVVGLPGHKEPYLARRVATDRSRMLTLLKIEANNLPVPQAAPKKGVRVGQWSVALGRTLDGNRDNPPSVSIGIISATGRIWGKAIQTDAKVSPVNYGGPLVDIQGRVQGILIPASPQGEDETAGFEWYDSGIGFAIPLQDALAVLARLKEGQDLKKGLLGVRLRSADIYSAEPVIGEVTSGSAASRAGLKAGDVITEIDGQPVVRMAQILHRLGPHYEGDTISLKYRRGKDVVSVARLELVGSLAAYTPPFLGILPVRDDPKLGVEIRYVYAKSPAEKAGIKAGDRIVKYGRDTTMQSFQGQKRGRNELLDFLNGRRPGEEVKLEVVRKAGGKAETVTLKLDALPGSSKDDPGAVPAKLPELASRGKALEPLETPPGRPRTPKGEAPKKAETGLVKRTVASGDRKYWVYVHEDYDPNVSHALVVWLHPPRQNKDEDVEKLTDAWADFCKDNHILLMGPQSDNEAGWLPSDGEFIQEAVREVLEAYTVDRQRVVAHGLGVGGQMALYLGFHDRELFRGVATTGAVATQPKANEAGQRLAFFVVAGERDPLAKAIAEGRLKLVERGFPVTFREIAGMGRQYLNEATLAELARWIDTLDKL